MFKKENRELLLACYLMVILVLGVGVAIGRILTVSGVIRPLQEPKVQYERMEPMPRFKQEPRLVIVSEN